MVCSFPLLHLPIPALSPCPTLLCSHEVRGIRAWVFLPWLPAVLWALLRSCCITKKAWPVKEEAIRIPLQNTRLASAIPKSTLNAAEWVDCEGGPSQTWRGPGTCQVSDLQSPRVKSPCFCISINSVVTQGLKLPKCLKMLSTQLSLNFGGIWALEI